MASRLNARADAAAGRPPPISFRGHLRIAVRLSGILFVLFVCLIPHGLWRALRQSSPWPRLFLGTVARIAGARVKRIGTHVRRDVVYLSNHVSWVDILAIAGATGSAFVAKAEVKHAPVVGWLADLNRTVYVDREDRGGVAAQIDRLREALEDTWSVTIFPEGTTNDGVSLLPFKSSLLKILEPAPDGVAVQPIFLDYGPDVGPDIGWLGVESGQDNAMRVLARRGSFRVEMHFLEPFSPVHHAGRKVIAAEARARIAAALERVHGTPPAEFIGHDHWAKGRAAL